VPITLTSLFFAVLAVRKSRRLGVPQLLPPLCPFPSPAMANTPCSDKNLQIMKTPTHFADDAQRIAVAKTKSSFRDLAENSTKSLCQSQGSENFCLLDLLRFSLCCATFGDDLVTVRRFNLSRT